MVTFKIVIGTKQGKCVQKDITDPQSAALLGKKVGDVLRGDDIGLAGYEFLITGGSDHCGFPMRKEIQGQGRKRIFAIEGVGLKKKAKGIRVRKTVCGNMIHEKISQVNLKITKEGKEPLIAPAEPEKKESAEDTSAAPENKEAASN
ncbi:30S ribosomal protein S6e [Candidatus Woesearchaeota archaeon]|nr:30S ribosomal protein S6e [Candidatus Woesearchaeota archaeon]